jgi:hypothetical protein
LLGGFFVRVWGIWQYQYNPDEMQFLIIAKGATLSEVWERNLAEIHPPLAQFIRHYLLIITSDIFIQRLFSVTAGMLSILGIYKLGLVLRSRNVGLFCALCMAFIPVAVSTSMLIRNYAFFMVFLASATHFTGFFVAAACGLSAGVQKLRTKKWQELILLSGSFIPLLLLSVFFYCHYLTAGTAGPMWHKVALINEYPQTFAGNAERTLTAVIGYFVPLLGLRLAEENEWIQLVRLVGMLWLFLIYIAGLKVLYKTTTAWFWIIVIVWIESVMAALTGIYPFYIGRQNYYLSVFFILPFAYLVEPLITAKRVYSACLISILFAGALSLNGNYVGYMDELSLKQKDYAESQKYLIEHIQPGDGLIGGWVFYYMYLLYAYDGGRTPYADYNNAPYFNHSTVLAPINSPQHPSASWTEFKSTLAKYIGDNTMKAGKNFWFVMYDWKDAGIWHLMECRDVKKDNFFSRDGIIIFSINSNTLKTFLKNDASWQACYSDYRPSLIADSFKAVPDPR